MRYRLNTYRKLHYLLEGLYWCLCSAALFYQLCYFPIYDRTRDASLLALAGLCLSALLLGMALTWRRMRNGISLLTMALFPLECYTLWSLAPYVSPLWLALLALAVLGVLAHLFRRLLLLPERGSRQARPRHFRLCAFRLLAQLSVVLILLLPLGYAGLKRHVLPTTLTVVPAAACVQDYDQAYIEQVVLGFSNEQWVELEPDARLELVAAALTHEAAQLGFGQEDTFCLRCAPMSAGEAGHYRHADREITLNEYRLKQCLGGEVLNTAMHELNHCNQYRLIAQYADMDPADVPLEIRTYQQEFQSYIHAENAAQHYYEQSVERDSRLYGKRIQETYEALIRRTLGS